MSNWRKMKGSNGTRESLLVAAQTLFSQRGYPSTSVSEICRQAGLANGTFYGHFENKEEIFTALVERLKRVLHARVERAATEERDPSKAILRAYRSVLAYAEEEPDLCRVGRSAEILRMGIERLFRMDEADVLSEILVAGIRAGRLRPVDPPTAAHALLGIIEFAMLRYVFWEPGALTADVLQALDDFILHGFDSGKPVAPVAKAAKNRRAAGLMVQDSPLSGGKVTRRALLAQAERLFGEAGFFATSISAITSAVGVAQGTFYVHFPSKVAFFVELVREVNSQLVSSQREAIAGLEDRRQIERAGFRAFFGFIGGRPLAFRVLREAELVNPEIGRWYYERLAKGYVRGLCDGIARGELRELAPEPLAYALLGIGHAVALAAQAGGEKAYVPEDRVASLLDALERGIASPVD
jgi:AcrR family transcriptional regulator